MMLGVSSFITQAVLNSALPKGYRMLGFYDQSTLSARMIFPRHQASELYPSQYQT